MALYGVVTPPDVDHHDTAFGVIDADAGIVRPGWAVACHHEVHDSGDQRENRKDNHDQPRTPVDEATRFFWVGVQGLLPTDLKSARLRLFWSGIYYNE